MLRARILVIALSLMLCLAACSESPTAVTAQPQLVKVEKIAPTSSAGNQSFVATLRAHQRSELSFETGGRIAEILVEVGDRVHAGQVLARLEDSPIRWRLERAEAERSAAVATLGERTTQLHQNELLAADHIISPVTLESAQVQHRQAQSQVQAAEAALAQARRDLSLSRIVAPFDGEIVARTALAHGDVGSGQAILRIEAGNTLEAVAMLPDHVANTLHQGDRAVVTIDGRSAPVSAVLDNLSARSENGSLVQAIFRVEDKTTHLRNGSSVSLELPRTASNGISIPASALIPESRRGFGSVYVFLPEQRKIVRQDVRYGDDLLPDGRIVVFSGLKAGDEVVIAGTSFLNDGQAALRYAPQTLLAEK